MLLPLQGVIKFVINYSQGNTLGWVLIGPSGRWIVFYSSTQGVTIGL